MRLPAVPVRGEQDPATYTEAAPDGWWYTAVLPDRWRIIAFHTDSDLPAARRVLRRGPANEAMTVPGLSEAIGPIQAAGAGRPQICSANSTARSAAG
jgi:(2Fe-2S) ferredoxin